MMSRVITGLMILASWLAVTAPASARPDSIITVTRSGSAPAVSIVLSAGGRASLVDGCSGGGCAECTDEVCSWGVPAGSEATLTVISAQGFVDTIGADCVGGLLHSEAAPGIAQTACTFATRSGAMPIPVIVNRPTIRLTVDGPTTAEVLDPNQAASPIVLTVTQGNGTVQVDRGAIVSFRQAPTQNAPGRVVLGGFSGDCVSAEPWCNVAIDKPLVSVTAKATSKPLPP